MEVEIPAEIFGIKKWDCEVISNYKPPIFWKDKQIVKNQVLKWNLKDSENLISRINETELNIKKNYSNSLNIVSDFIINTAK